MTLELSRPADFLRLVDAEKGTVDRSIFSADEIYQLELERIFARAWNFMAHESQVPNPGDFFQTYIGEDRMIVVRDKEGGVQVLLNTCRHRGNAVCRAEEGHATSFMCTYHGWTYDLKGRLVGVPGFKDYYHEDLNREEWGLVTAAKVDSYCGFIFATLDPDAPALADFLGEVGRLAIQLHTIRGDMKVVGGIQKYIIGCNWKLAVDNLWDFYHPQISHSSAFMSGYAKPIGLDGKPTSINGAGGGLGVHNVLLGEYGHALGGPMMTEERIKNMNNVGGIDNTWRLKPEMKAALGPVGIETSGHPNLFPNLWLTANQLCLRLPRGPLATEIWWFTLIDANLNAEQRELQLRRANHTFGPAGILEQEDGENWDQSTRGTVGTVSKRFPLNYSMGVGHGEIREEELGPPRILTTVNEHAQLWHYRSWAEWMAADSWKALEANHSPTPSGVV
jgi:phenylpropionate dioxygenase-like ring-hydroxylating dioxygenase large terminal subunit